MPANIVGGFAGLTAGIAAFHSGAGVIGALMVGLLYAVPAGIAGRSDWPRSACPPKAGARRLPSAKALPAFAVRTGQNCAA